MDPVKPALMRMEGGEGRKMDKEQRLGGEMERYRAAVCYVAL